ncbi:AIPR family protein, partial [Morganella morganii]
ANVRDYLGSRSSDSNINHGIKKTIENEHNNFWAYNNGLTILTHGFKYSKNLITLNGISIVNGAQTTGAIGSLKKLPNKNAKVQARFIAVNGDNNSLIEDIIRYNNSQNKVEAADFRSTDRVQKRLKDEFNSIPDAEYEGGRRGSTSDAIRRRPNLLSSYSVGQALAAFHGEPIVAYNKKAGIWVNNKTYDKLFNDHTKAAHIVACYSLVRAIEDKKKNLQNKSNLTLSETNVLNFLRQRGAIFLTTHAISSCLEHILGRSVPNLFRISFGNKCSPSNAINNWKIILDILMPLVVHLKPAIENGMKNSTEIDNAVNIFSSLVGTITDVNSEKFDEFKSKITAP